MKEPPAREKREGGREGGREEMSQGMKKETEMCALSPSLPSSFPPSLPTCLPVQTYRIFNPPVLAQLRTLEEEGRRGGREGGKISG